MSLICTVENLVGDGVVVQLPSVNDYVQSGLIACYDGLENAGVGVHQTSPSTWKDLVGNRDITLGSTFRWGNKYLHNMGWTQCASPASNPIAAASFRTMEVVYRQDMKSARQQQVMHIVLNNYSGAAGTGKGISYEGNSINKLYSSRSSSTTKGISTASTTCGAIRTASFTYGSAMTVTGSYLNGNATTASSSSISRDYLTTKNLTIGTTYYPFLGRIYCIRIYNRELSASEVAANAKLDNLRYGAGRTNQMWSMSDPVGGITTQLSDCASQLLNNVRLTSVNLPACTNLGSSTFSGCTSLKKCVFRSLTNIAASTFNGCTGLELIDFSGQKSVPALANTNAFSSTNSTYTILVPDNLYNSWIATANWSNATIKARIVKVSSYSA